MRPGVPSDAPGGREDVEALRADESFAGRYRIGRELGRGGAALVVEAEDLRRGRRVALKQLLPSAVRRRAALSDYFRSEFQTLSQLSHPQVIRVYDSGVSALGPYYTMELLEYGDLREAAPLRWERACEVLMQVASSLAILHARRILHNDVSPRNLRFNEDGRVKLIDFGAMSGMGVPACVAGTPATVSPEAVHGQPLDARSDLFSLGALAYWVLTGRHARSARSHAELRRCREEVAPGPPSSLVAGIPEKLDELVLELLSFDPMGRPPTAGVVIDRLGAILGMPPAEEGELASSFLVMPALVGCEDAIQRFRDALERTREGRGGSMVLEGEAGRGRTRLLSRCVLEADLEGVLVARAAASGLGDYALVRSLFEDLADKLPAEELRACLGPRAAIVAGLAPSLEGRLGLRAASTPGRSELESALAEGLLAVAEQQALVVAADDVHGCDARSLALLARWASAAPEWPLLVLSTSELGTSSRAPKALEILRQAGTRVRLPALDAAGTETLLGSIFGKVENVRLVASWAYRIAEGNAAATLALAQHLVDHGIAVFEAGAWRLPDTLRGLALPGSIGQAHALRIAALDGDARSLAHAFAVATEHAPLSAEHCAALLSDGDGSAEEAQARVFRALGELLERQVATRGEAGQYSIGRGLLEALRSGLEVGERRSIHADLAKLYANDPQSSPAIVAHHLQQSGRPGEALCWVLSWVARLDWDDASDFALVMAPLGRQVLESALDAAGENGASPLDLYRLRRCLLDIALRADPEAIVHADALGEQLRRESGLVYWQELAGECPVPEERVVRCLERAQAVYDATPEAERGLPPATAMRAFARFASSSCAVYSRILDLDRLLATHDVLKPLEGRIPVAAAMHQIVRLSVERNMWGDDVAALREGVIERLATPLEGMDDHSRASAQSTLVYHSALEETFLSTPDALRRADALESQPGFEALAWQVRRIWNICNTDEAEARRCGRRMELLVIGEIESHMALPMSLFFEVDARTAAGDAMALKRLLPRFEEQAARFPGWQCWCYLIRGLLHELRGQHRLAHAELRECLARVSPDRGAPVWLRAMEADLRALTGMGALDSVRASGEQSLALLSEAARRRPVQANSFQVALARAESLSGMQEVAEQRIDAALARAREMHLARLFVGDLLETRAWLALRAGDGSGFRSHYESLAEIFGTGRYPALTARLERLGREAQHAGLGQSVGSSAAVGAGLPRRDPQEVRRLLDRCRGSEERAEACLQILAEASGAEDGYLYTLGADGPVVTASLRGHPPAAELDTWVAESLSSILAEVTEYSPLDPDEVEAEDAARAEWTLAVISAPRESHELVAGVAALRAASRPIAEPELRAICEALVSAGDVTPPRAEPLR